MANQAVPVIRGENYDIIRRMLNGDLPATFEGWDYETFKKRAYIQSVGHQPVDIEIDPREFTDFCRSWTGQSLNEAITSFVNDKLVRQL